MQETRKLRTILFADIAGYTALMQSDEQQALHQLGHFKEILTVVVPSHQGKIIQYFGDGCLLTFESATQGVQCASALQQAFGEREIPVRMGMHLGEVLLRNNNAFGDGVNLASRIESMGVPGAVLVSKTVRNQLQNKAEFSLRSLGSFDFKNVSEPIEVFALANAGLIVPKRADLKGKGKQTQARKPNWPVLMGGIVGAAILILAGTYFWKGDNPEAFAENGDKAISSIAVFPFDVKGSPDIEYLGEGIVDLISTQLDEIPTLRSVDPNVLISRLSRETVGVRNPDEYARLSAGLGANKFILGSVIELGESLQFSATKYGSNGQKIITQTIKARQRSALAETIDELIKKLVAVELEESGFEMGSLGAITSGNLESLKFYLLGEQASRNSHRREAVGFFNKAVELDSTFALAWMRLGRIAQGSWADKENFALTQWSRYSKTMPQKWQDYHEAYMSDSPGKLDKYKNLIRRYGESPEFLNSFAGYLYYAHTSFGSSCLDAKPYYLRALELDSGDLSHLISLTKLAVIENDSAAIQQYLSMADTSHGFYGYLKLSEFLFMDTLTDQQIQEFMDVYSSKLSWLYVTHQFPENKLVNLRLIERLLSVRSDPFSEFSYRDIKYGTSGQEKAHFESWQNTTKLWGIDIPRFWRCMPATFIGDKSFSPYSEHYDLLFMQTRDANSPYEIYAAIKYALALGLQKEAKELKAKLRRLSIAPEIQRVARYYDYSIQAFEARLAGDDDLALSHIDSAFQYIFSLHWIERDASRLDKTIMTANIYAQKGDFEKAISFYNPYQYGVGSSTFRGYATYQLSHWYEQIGDLKNSLLKCNLFLESYQNCDEKYQPWVEEVQARKERLLALEG